MKEQAPKPKSKLTREEAEIRALNDATLSFQLRLLDFLQKENPALAAKLKPEFEEYVLVEKEVAKENPTGNYSVKDIRLKIPNNGWLKFIEMIVKQIPASSITQQEKEEAQRQFQKEVDKKMRGQDIN